MEASELTLIEISAEDDSLLHQLPSNDVVSASTSGFAFDFSPLQTPRSNIPSSSSGKKSNAERCILGSGSSYSNKENLNTIDNKSGMRNLSVERQRMKKSRKGYNMRKSLAWDKAFFTEEGVLDSEELSMISGMSHVGRLSVIDEEPRDSLTLTTDVPSGSANIESLEENLFKELPSGQSSITYTSSPLMKRDSISRSSLSVISRSSQKAAANRGLRKSGSKLGVCSTPVAPSSQKRLLNTGTTKVMPRNSKIPRVPVSKHPPLMSTNMHAPLSGSHLKSPAISQPAQRSTSLTLPSNTKSASKVASISSGGTSKSIKHLATNARRNSTCSSSEIGSSTNHKAGNTGKVSNSLQNNSKQGLPVKMIEPVSGIGRSRIPSHLPSDNSDGHRKDAQSQGIKGSGLRMPSPSMRFFSEGNKKSSNLKSSIPASKKSEAADHVSDFKQIKVQHGSLNHDAVSEKRLSSQVTELCSTASLVDPIEHTEAKHAECNQQVVQQEVPLGDKVPQPTNNADDIKNPLNNIDIQCINENPTSLTVEEKDMNKFVDINSNDSSLNQNRNADGNSMNSSYATCHKVQLTVASSAIGEVSSILNQETGCSSSATNDGDLLESEIDFSGQHDNFTLAADSNPSPRMLYNEKNPGECMIDYLGQSNTEGNIDAQLGDSKLYGDDQSSYGDDQSSSDMDEGDTDNEETRNCIQKCGIVRGAANEHVNKKQDDVIFNGTLSATKFGECSTDQDNASNHVPHNENDNVSSVTLKISGSKEISDVDSILGEPESTEISNHSSTSFLKLSNNDADLLPFLPFSLQGPQEQPLFHGSPHATSVTSSYGTEATINRETESTQEGSDDPIVNLAVSKRDNLDLSNCVQMEDILLSRHQEGCNIEISEELHQVHSSVQEVEFQIDSISCLSEKGNNSTFHSYGSVSAEEPETNCNMKVIRSDYDTEANINRDTELSQVLHDDSMVNFATSKRDELELNNGVLLNDCFLNTDQEGSNVEISDDIHQVHMSVEGVKTQTDSDSCLSSKGNKSTFQTDGSVSAEVPEIKCDTEGICSIYGTEATINSSNEYAQVVNDDSTVNKDDIDLCNDVVLKDGLLKRDQGDSNIEISGDIWQGHNCVEEVEFLTDLVICLPSNGSNAAHQIDDSVSAEEPESKCNAVDICSDCGTEATINKDIEFSAGMNDVSIVHLASSERDDMDLNGVPLKDNFLKTDRGGCIERTGDIHQVHSVSAKEPETNCNMEGICSDYGTEANINRDTDLSQILNDDSMFYLATSKSDELQLNNSVLLKDCFLNTEEGTNVEISDDIHQMHISVEGVETQTDSDSCLFSKGNNPTFQTDGRVSAEVPETKCDMEGICAIYGTEATINRSTEIAQVVNDDLIVTVETSKGDDIDWNNDVVLNDSFLKIDRGGSKIEISGDIHQVHSSVEEVEFLIDSISCLSSKGNDAAYQIDGSVYAEEPESKCNMEGVCSDCVTEATINRNIEFSQDLNDDCHDFIVNLATSKRDDMDINNGVLLDSLLKTDTGASNIEISGDIHQVHSSVEEVEFQTDSVSSLSSKGNNGTYQTDDSVFAEENENKCNTEGIGSFEVNANLDRTDKQNVSIPPPHAVPFSDEWLAAIESAGEEILTMKTGAVQHSPTDKSAPEPSPWSPVKRKTAQMIGPFDCTKHTHIQPDQSE